MLYWTQSSITRKMIFARPLCAFHMVGGLSFCPSIIRSPLYHPGSYLIIMGVCKTHPVKVSYFIKAHAGCSLQWRPYLCGLFSFPGFPVLYPQRPALVLIRNEAEQRTARIRLNIHLWPTWSPSSLLRFLATGKDDPVSFFLYPARSQKKLAVCLNSTSISDIELFFLSVIQKLPEKATLGVIRNSKVARKRRLWCHP